MSSSYGLALHTTSPQLGLTIDNLDSYLSDKSIDRRFRTYDLGRDLSTHLHYHLQEFIAPQLWQDLTFIAVAKGPGSFTSTRIGVVTARTLAQQLNIPLFGVSSLAAIAWDLKENYPIDTKLAIEMPASRGEIFGAIYQYRGANNLVAIVEDLATSPAQWQEILHKYEISSPSIVAPVNLGYTSVDILELATIDYRSGKRSQWFDLLPFYGQHSTC